VEVGSGAGVIDFALPEPVPPPVTTIAWRLGHVVVGVLGERNARYFGGPPTTDDTYDYPLDATTALRDLDAGFACWVRGVRGLAEADLVARCGEPGHEDSAMAELVLHINRELIHHLAEVALLRRPVGAPEHLSVLGRRPLDRHVEGGAAYAPTGRLTG
jgi:hypothetical protein